MQIELNQKEAETLRELLHEKVVELDKEINRTDSLSFKGELREIERRIEHVLGEVSTALGTETRTGP